MRRAFAYANARKDNVYHAASEHWRRGASRIAYDSNAHSVMLS
jgi:hypothetical protein